MNTKAMFTIDQKQFWTKSAVNCLIPAGRQGLSTFPRSGFTLLEMLVSTGILIILSGIMVGYSRSAYSGLELTNKQYEMLALLFNSKSLSQSFVLNPPPSKQICAYGVHIDRFGNKAFVFQDLVDDADDCAASDNIFTSGEELAGPPNNFYLSSQLEYGNSTDPASPNLSDIIFIPPDPSVVINHEPPGTRVYASASVIVQLKTDPSQNFKIKVNNFGQISLE